MSIFDRLHKMEESEGTLEQRVIAALRTVYDPEIPVNIYDLGLIYGLAISDAGVVDLRMTLTAPGCPVAQSFPDVVRETLEGVPGVNEARVELVWDPPWSRERMSEAARGAFETPDGRTYATLDHRTARAFRPPAAALFLDRGRLQAHAGSEPASVAGAGPASHAARGQPERGRHLQLEV